MKNPTIDTSHASVHFTTRNGKFPKVIVLHHTAGTNSLKYLTKNIPQVSTHVLIANDGIIYKMVTDELAANTVGFSALGIYNRTAKYNCNDIALNIELENMGNGIDTYTDEQVYSTAYTIVQWFRKYGPMPIISHALIDTNGKNDPYMFPWYKLYIAIGSLLDD